MAGSQVNFSATGQGKTCILWEDVIIQKSLQKVIQFNSSMYQIAMIECSLTEAIKIHTDQLLGSDVHYVFLHPSSADEMTLRLIRHFPGEDTKLTLAVKQAKMEADVEDAKNLKWLTKSFENKGTTSSAFLKKAALYIVFDLYKLSR